MEWMRKMICALTAYSDCLTLRISFSNMIDSQEPTDSVCIARSWLTSLGISSVLSAVLVKMSTINRIMQKSKKLKRVQVSRQAMFGSLGVLLLIDITFLIAWANCR